jgi:hypothetical protein
MSRAPVACVIKLATANMNRSFVANRTLHWWFAITCDGVLM